MSSRVAPARRAQRRLGRALLLGAGGAARCRGGPPGALHVVGRLRRAARTARRSRPGDRGELPGARRREPACRPRSGRPERSRVLRQEHDADHPHPRVLGRARNTRQRSRARVDAGARHRLWGLQDLYRRVPDRRARRAGHARRDEMPLLLDAGTHAHSRGVSRAARRTGVRLRHLPGRLPLEPRRGEAPGRPGADDSGARGSRRVARVRHADPRLRPSVRAPERPAVPAPQRARRARQRRRARAHRRARTAFGRRARTVGDRPDRGTRWAGRVGALR